MLTPFFKQHFPLSHPRPATGLGVLTVADRPLVLAHYLGLDEEARRQRFGTTLSDELIKDWVRKLPLKEDAVLGYFEKSELVGLLYLIKDPVQANRGEAALSVKPAAQGRGIGTHLTLLAMWIAKQIGLTFVDIHYQRNNDAMTRITSRLPGSRHFWNNEVHVVVDVNNWVAAYGIDELEKG